MVRKGSRVRVSFRASTCPIRVPRETRGRLAARARERGVSLSFLLTEFARRAEREATRPKPTPTAWPRRGELEVVPSQRRSLRLAIGVQFPALGRAWGGGVEETRDSPDGFATAFEASFARFQARVEEACAGRGAWPERIAERLATDRAAELPDLAPQAIQFALTPYLGAAEARRVAAADAARAAAAR